MMEWQATTGRQKSIKNAATQDQDQTQQPPPSSTSRDPPPLIRHDFVTSPWKRFRPSTDDVRWQPRRPLSTVSGNLQQERQVRDAAKLCAPVECEEPRARSRSRCPGFTGNAGTTSCGNERCRMYVPSSVNFQSFPVHHVTEALCLSERQVDGPSRCSKFTVKAHSRFDLASSTGMVCTCCQICVFSSSCQCTLSKCIRRL